MVRRYGKREREEDLRGCNTLEKGKIMTVVGNEVSLVCFFAVRVYIVLK
jgi:hypothetical protein